MYLCAVVWLQLITLPPATECHQCVFPSMLCRFYSYTERSKNGLIYSVFCWQSAELSGQRLGIWNEYITFIFLAFLLRSIRCTMAFFRLFRHYAVATTIATVQFLSLTHSLLFLFSELGAEAKLNAYAISKLIWFYRAQRPEHSHSHNAYVTFAFNIFIGRAWEPASDSFTLHTRKSHFQNWSTQAAFWKGWRNVSIIKWNNTASCCQSQVSALSFLVDGIVVLG